MLLQLIMITTLVQKGIDFAGKYTEPYLLSFQKLKNEESVLPKI